MSNQSLKILLVEDNAAEVDLIQELLTEASPTPFELRSVNRLADGIECLRLNGFNIVLLDLSLPDSRGLETVIQFKAEAASIPMIVLTALNDELIALESVRKGAQDYLFKGQLEGELLVRAINYAIERQQIEETLRQQAQRERLLAQMIERIRESLDIRDILTSTLEAVQQLLKAERVALYRKGLNPVYSFGKGFANDAEAYTPRQAKPLGTLIVKLDASQNCIWNPQLDGGLAPLERSPPVESTEPKEDTLDGARSLLKVPIWQSDSTVKQNQWGELVAEIHQSDRAWQQWEIEFLQQLANQVAIAIHQSELYRQLERANRELQELATTDDLTGVANRRQFEQVLNQEWQRLLREQQPLSLIMCDIDCFKAYNDTYGHPAGDKCIQQVSQVLQQATQRSADLVTRYGGEEFAVILPNTDASGALQVAQRIRNYLAALGILHQSSPVSQSITLSIGVATKIPNPKEAPISLVQSADNALYQAKAEGRDRLVQH